MADPGATLPPPLAPFIRRSILLTCVHAGIAFNRGHRITGGPIPQRASRLIRITALPTVLASSCRIAMRYPGSAAVDDHPRKD
jgi:hypothetical protein